MSTCPAYSFKICGFYTVFFFALVILSSCQKSSLPAPGTNTQKLLALGHPGADEDFVLDSEVAQIDFSKYELLLLAGDLSEDSTGDTSVTDWLDKVYDLGNENTLWAPGNHDYANPKFISMFTGRPLSFSHNWNKIIFIVLDNQDSMSHITHDQLSLINSVLDTLSDTKYLVFLHHKLIWMPGHPELESQIPDVANAGLGDCAYCTNPNNFYEVLYPKLIEVKNKGTEVICLAGDIGFKAKSFEFQTTEGIWFLATGILAGDSGNLALVFEYNSEKERLIWNFRKLSSL